MLLETLVWTVVGEVVEPLETKVSANLHLHLLAPT